VVFNIINEKTRESCENLVDKVLKTGQITGIPDHTALIRKDGAEIIIEDSAAPIRDRNSTTIGTVLVFRDVTEKRRMEDELLKMDKLQSVGLLAGGIAHDFNNILTSVVGNISLAKMYLDAGSEAYERLIKAEQASQRATELAYRLLTFSKGGEPVRKPASIVDILKESSDLDLSGSNIASEFIIPEDICNVDVDTGQMSQVFSNLIINAVQAMPSGGKIVYSVSNVLVEGDKIPGLEDGTYVHISVKDSGTGISKEDLARIFDPYFTTKQGGSGLGLASAYSIIKRHCGHITVESKHGVGTIFHIYLPVSGSKSVCNISEEQSITAGQGKVLVMDDEKIVRDISGEMLKSLGYEVEFADNGAEAIEMYQRVLEAGRPFDLVIMDLTIPGGMGGKEAIQKLRSIDPDVKAIVSSGYSNDPIMADFKEYGFRGVIIKPYRIEGFSRALHQVITA
jgi:signal transduction histidine kinase/ActR/RegA family two-component response regulator